MGRLETLRSAIAAVDQVKDSPSLDVERLGVTAQKIKQELDEEETRRKSWTYRAPNYHFTG
jgi:hypothetical protein